MKKYYLSSLLALCITLITGCQTLSNQRFFLPRGYSDEAVTSSVNLALINNPEFSKVQIHVETHQGTVYLRGFVKTIRQSDTAGDVASKVRGVKLVDNGLIVRK